MATNVLGNRADAHRQLNRRVRSGALRARAQAFLTQPDYGPIPTKLPAHPLPGFKMSSPARPLGIVLGPAFWKNPGRSIHEPKLWKWTDGVFAMVNMTNSSVIRRAPGVDRCTQDTNERFVYFGVSFLKREIEAFLISVKKPTGKANSAKRQQARRLGYKWNSILGPLIEIAKAGNLEKNLGHLSDVARKKVSPTIYSRRSGSTIQA